MNQKFQIVGNWKMNPENRKEATKLFSHYKRCAAEYPHCGFTACVPAVFLCGLERVNRDRQVMLAAQNIYHHDHGSFTGAVSIPMVRDAGCERVLIGHSEMRTIFGVDNDMVTSKIEHSIIHKMPMIVCCGEDTRDESGDYISELETQLAHILEPCKKHRASRLLTLAYEPVWAIGAGAKRSVTHEELFSTILLIRNIVEKHLGPSWAKKVPILYGGSVNPLNAQELAGVPGIQGFLIGRAGLSREGLEGICKQLA